MKKVIIFIPILAFIIYSFAEIRDATVSKDGITFFEGTWEQALQKSKAENKPIFVDFSTSWCGWCKRLKRNAFSEKEVGAYFNSNFINMAIDAEKGEGPKLAQKYNVEGFPTLIVVDDMQELMLFSSGYVEKEDLILFGKTSIKNYNKIHSNK